MRLHPKTQVNQLAYNPQLNQLSFCLIATGMSIEACLFPDSVPETQSNTNQKTVGDLKLNFRQQPLTIHLAIANIR